jgi:hypothetical protein
MARTPTSLGRGVSASRGAKAGATIFVADILFRWKRREVRDVAQKKRKGLYSDMDGRRHDLFGLCGQKNGTIWVTHTCHAIIFPKFSVLKC